MRETIRDLQTARRQQDQELARLTAELRTLRLSSTKSTPSQQSQLRALVLRAGSQPSDWYPPDTPSTQLLPAPPRPPVIPIYLYDSSSDEEPSLPFDRDPPESPVSQQELCPACGDLENCPECGLLLFEGTSQSEDLEEQEELQEEPELEDILNEEEEELGEEDMEYRSDSDGFQDGYEYEEEDEGRSP